MKILFLVYHGFSEVSGISKKIHYQVKGLRENGHEVHLCFYAQGENEHWQRLVEVYPPELSDVNYPLLVLRDYGAGKVAGIRQRISYSCVFNYCIREEIDFVYARCFMNASPWLISFFKKLNKAGVKAVTEIPTYPYDAEFKNFEWKMRMGLWIDQLFRNKLYSEQEAVVTFSDADCIFSQRTIRISNGVDFDSIPIHNCLLSSANSKLHLIAVAEVHPWHGFDRLIKGLGEFYVQGGKRDVVFHIVGGVHPIHMAKYFTPLIQQYSLQDKVIFHGTLFGDELTKVFNQCQFAIGSLGRHRSGITVIKTLKNREYATRGIPFIYSEQDNDFEGQPYILKAPADESPIDIQQIIDFIDGFTMKPEDIRRTVEHLTWKIQMQRVLDFVFNN